MKWFSLLIVLSFQLSCRKASEANPTFLKCDSAIITSTKFGDPITSIYGFHVSVETDDRGTWEFPFLMPILKSGIKKVVFRPVVKRNNISTLFNEYPMYKLKDIDLNLIPGKTIDTNLEIEYDDNISMLMNETMEIKTNFSASARNLNARSGSYSMYMKSDFASGDTSINSYASSPVPLSSETTIFMEFDYYMPKGVMAPALSYTNSSGGTQTIYGDNFLNKNAKWTHVYWFFTPYIVGRGVGTYYPSFHLTAAKGESIGECYIDNVKILVK